MCQLEFLNGRSKVCMCLFDTVLFSKQTADHVLIVFSVLLVVGLTNIFSAFDEGLDSPLVEVAVTVVATLSGLMVWCTFKNFLSVTFMMMMFYR